MFRGSPHNSPNDSSPTERDENTSARASLRKCQAFRFASIAVYQRRRDLQITPERPVRSKEEGDAERRGDAGFSRSRENKLVHKALQLQLRVSTTVEII
ncbi:hypothetical protein AAFF_G00423510 [Aldrovandia affinis]|uniref:Uncharacterized protein n=1 Tax=Aldrovandia affinis TaxID=143900 RepID=A0AAD7T858_9TELE|nr:hypothetical protein AAFF_G00423510 [Aldrovandia affinis]